MHSSTIFQAPPIAVDFFWSCDKVYHKQEVCFLLLFIGQIDNIILIYWIKIYHVLL